MIELRQTARRLLRAPGFTLATVLTLAIGIGATTAIFSVVNGVLLKPLPFPEPERLVALRHRMPGIFDDIDLPASVALYYTYKEHSETFESVALYTHNAASITGDGAPEEVRRLLATHELFGTLGVRPLLGAGWTTIARGLLSESLLLGLAGGGAGLALALAGLPLLLAFAADELPQLSTITVDSTVLSFTAAISVGCGLLFGAIPLARHAAPRIAAVLTTSARGYSAGRERHRARNALVIMQVALALVLLVASGLMIRTFQSLRDVDPGFTQPDRIQTFRISIPQGMVPEFDRVVRMQNDIENRLAAIPGVESVGFSVVRPLTSRGGPSGPFLLEDRPGAGSISLDFRYVSPGFFRALGAPLVAGRELEWRDYHEGARPVAVMSEGLARREWGSPAAAVGRRLRRGPSSEWLEVVGVVGDVRHHGIERPAPDAIYLTSSEALAPFASRTVYFFVRSGRVATAGFLDELHQGVWSVNPNLPLGDVGTLGDVYRDSMARTSLTLVLLGITGAMALLLGVVGIYGVIGYLVVQRTRELGIRMALGARNRALLWMLLRHVLLLAAAGIALGLGGAAALARLMESLLFGVAAVDPVTYAVAAVVLIATAALAGWLPACRVTRIDPTRALREE